MKVLTFALALAALFASPASAYVYELSEHRTEIIAHVEVLNAHHEPTRKHK